MAWAVKCVKRMSNSCNIASEKEALPTAKKCDLAVKDQQMRGGKTPTADELGQKPRRIQTNTCNILLKCYRSIASIAFL